MLEYPELYVLTNQMNDVLTGRSIQAGRVLRPNGNLFMEKGEGERYALLEGAKVLAVDFCPPEFFIQLDNGYGILCCQGGGKWLFSDPNAKLPANPTIQFDFADRSALTYTMRLWSLGVLARGQQEWEARKQTLAGTYFAPFGEGELNDFLAFVEGGGEEWAKLPVKTFLAKHIAGVMSTLAAEILLYAKVYPGKRVELLNAEEKKRIYWMMKEVLSNASEAGGKAGEVDLFGKPGAYTAMTERKYIGQECPVCGHVLEKNATGGVTAYCPNCQRK